VLVISGKSLFSLDPALAVSQYLRTSWTQEEGVDVPAVQAVAQGPDGYLWLGTSQGLIRFDGMRFLHWEPRIGEKLPSNDIRFLIASPAQGLWIGTASGVSRLFGGKQLRPTQCANQNFLQTPFGSKPVPHTTIVPPAESVRP